MLRALKFVSGLVGRGGGLVLALLLTASCQPGPPKPAADAEVTPEGCWELDLAVQGAQLDSVRTWLRRGALPPVVELDTTRASGRAATDSARVAYSWFDGRRETAPFSLWRRMRGDSLLVQQAGARSGLMLRLVHDESGLQGAVVSFSDVGTPDSPTRRHAPVEAVRVDCPEPRSMVPGGDHPSDRS